MRAEKFCCSECFSVLQNGHLWTVFYRTAVPRKSARLVKCALLTASNQLFLLCVRCRNRGGRWPLRGAASAGVFGFCVSFSGVSFPRRVVLNKKWLYLRPKSNYNKKTQDFFSRPRKKYVNTYEIRAVTAQQTYVFIFFIRVLEKKS